MSTSISKFFLRREDGAPSRWDQYRTLLNRKRGPRKAQVWHVRHVERFSQSSPERRLGTLSKDEIDDYLRRLSSDPSYKDWQIRQSVDALHILLVDLGGCRASMAVDWDYFYFVTNNSLKFNPDHRGRGSRG